MITTHYNDPKLWFHILDDPQVVKNGNDWQITVSVQVDKENHRQYKIDITAVLSDGNTHVRHFTLSRPLISKVTKLPLGPYEVGREFPLEFNLQMIDKSQQLVSVHAETV